MWIKKILNEGTGNQIQYFTSNSGSGSTTLLSILHPPRILYLPADSPLRAISVISSIPLHLPPFFLPSSSPSAFVLHFLTSSSSVFILHFLTFFSSVFALHFLTSSTPSTFALHLIISFFPSSFVLNSLSISSSPYAFVRHLLTSSSPSAFVLL